MFKNLANLDVDIHKNLLFEPSVNLNFAADVPTAPLAASELTQAMRHFPIVFSTDDPMVPVALMSLKQDTNAFVDSAGTWLGEYLPAHIRRYPFILGHMDDPETFTIMFDTDAPEINTMTGSPLYEENGEMAPALKQVVEFLQAFQNELTTTEQLIKPLIEKDVLTMQTISVNRPDGSAWKFEGVRAVDGDRIKALDDATVAEWVRTGLMAIVYAHLHSLENIRYMAERQGLISKEA